MPESPRQPIDGEEFSEPLPVPEPVLRGLFKHLDNLGVVALVDNQIRLNCDHTMDKVRAYLESHCECVDQMIEWLRLHGAGCDCEVLFNTTGEYARVYGESE